MSMSFGEINLKARSDVCELCILFSHPDQGILKNYAMHQGEDSWKIFLFLRNTLRNLIGNKAQH